MNIDEDENVRMAKARLAQEANAALSYGRRGVSNITEQFNAASKGEQSHLRATIKTVANAVSRAVFRSASKG